MDIQMKTHSFILGFLAIFLLISCDTVTFDVSDTSSSTIDKVLLCPPDVGVTVPDFMKQNMENIMDAVMIEMLPAVEAEAKKRDTWPVDSIILKTLTMSMDNIPNELRNDNTLGFLTGIEVFLVRDGEPDTLWAVAESIQGGATSIQFSVNRIDLQPLVEKGLNTKTRISARYCPSEEIDVTLKYTIEVGF
jgi:hypothetical protein